MYKASKIIFKMCLNHPLMITEQKLVKTLKVWQFSKVDPPPVDPITHLHKFPRQFIRQKFFLLFIVDCQGLLLLLESLDLLEQGVADKLFLLLGSCLLCNIKQMGTVPKETSVKQTLATWHGIMFSSLSWLNWNSTVQPYVREAKTPAKWIMC